MNTAYTIDAFDSRQISHRVLTVALKKSKQSWYFVILRNAYGGALLGMGGLFYVIMSGGTADLTTADPGRSLIQKPERSGLACYRIHLS